MIVTETNPGPARVIGLAGRLDDDTADEVRRRLDSTLRKAGRKARLILDLSEVDYISAKGLKTIFHLAREINRLDGRLVVCGLGPNAAESFKVTHLSALVPICPNAKAALQEF